MKKKKEMSIDDLAIIIKKSFDDVERRFNGVEKRLDDLEVGQNNLEIGQKEIKRKLNFTVHMFDLKELEYRVEKLEKVINNR